MDSEHHGVKWLLCDIEIVVLIECSVFGFAFINENFIRQDNFPLHKLKVLRMVEVINGSLIESKDIELLEKLRFTIQDNSREVSAFVILA